MRFSIYINQQMMLDHGLDCKEAMLFGCVYDAQAWATKIVADGDVWVWLAKDKFLTELPVIGSWETFKKRKQSLKEKGLIEYRVIGNKQLFRLTELGQKWNEASGVNSYPSSAKVGSNLTPVEGSNLTPNTLTTNTLSINKKTKAKKAKFVKPSFEQVRNYAIERNRVDLAKKFFDYYEAGSWRDKAGNAVRNWKQKFLTWENNNAKPNQQNGSSGPLVGSDIDGAWLEDL